MRLGDYLLWLVQAYNPNKYDSLLESKWSDFLKFLFITVGLALLLFTAILVPITFNYMGSISGLTAQTQALQIDAVVEADHPIELLPRPSIILDLQSNETTSGDIVLTSEGIIYPKYIFFGESMVNWADVKDLKQETPVRDHFLKGFVIFLIPSIMFWFFVYSMLKVFLISLLLFMLGILTPKIFSHAIATASCLKILILSLPSLLFIDLGLYPLAPLFWWGVLLTAVLFFVGVALVSERKISDDHQSRKRKV